MEKIILIGGAPTLGKSYLARYLSKKFELPWISTDMIRDQMRLIVRKEDYPRLFDFDTDSGKTAENYLTTNTAKEVVDDQNAESEDVWKGVSAIIKEDYVWKSFIVEGVAVLPKLVSKIKINKILIPLFIVDKNENRIRDTIYTRGLWEDARNYPDSVKELEVNWVMEYNKYTKSEAEKYGYEIYAIEDREEFVKIIEQKLKTLL